MNERKKLEVEHFRYCILYPRDAVHLDTKLESKCECISSWNVNTDIVFSVIFNPVIFGLIHLQIILFRLKIIDKWVSLYLRINKEN